MITFIRAAALIGVLLLAAPRSAAQTVPGLDVGAGDPPPPSILYCVVPTDHQPARIVPHNAGTCTCSGFRVTLDEVRVGPLGVGVPAPVNGSSRRVCNQVEFLYPAHHAGTEPGQLNSLCRALPVTATDYRCDTSGCYLVSFFGRGARCERVSTRSAGYVLAYLPYGVCETKP